MLNYIREWWLEIVIFSTWFGLVQTVSYYVYTPIEVRQFATHLKLVCIIAWGLSVIICLVAAWIADRWRYGK